MLAVVVAVASAQDRRLPSSPAAAMNRRFALAAGNDAYAGLARLRNATNDARAVRDALTASGWNATLLENGTKEALERAVDAFARQAGPGDEAIFFYAGHGIQTEGVNYLIPVDFTATDATDAKYRGVSADWVHEKLTARGVALNVMILDACRDNPFSSTRSGSSGGLAEIRGARGSLVAFATGPGKTAADSPGSSNGLFTGFLVEALKKPGLSHNDVFDEVRARVVEASRGAQIPWVNSSVVGRFVFNPGGGSDASRMAQAPPPVQALPRPAEGASLDLSDLAQRAEAAKAWDDYQAKMMAAFQSTEQFERGTGLADLKATAWERFVTVYAQDNPLSREDDRLRNDARARARRWKDAATAAIESAKASVPAFSPPTGGTGGGSGAHVNSTDGLIYAPIPAGSFDMGCSAAHSECDGDERPRHRVSVSGFWMGTTEVTVGAFGRFASSSGRRVPSGQASADHPVVEVDWNDAKAFCTWAGGRLPSEAEWEYAARGGLEGMEYVWGNESAPLVNGRKMANVADESAKRKNPSWSTVAGYDDGFDGTSPVGSFPANAYGLYDMAGNVWEWVEDGWHDNYNGAPSDGTVWSGGNTSRRVSRGGSWYSNPRRLRVSLRSHKNAGDRNTYFGFRCSRDAVP